MGSRAASKHHKVTSPYHGGQRHLGFSSSLLSSVKNISYSSPLSLVLVRRCCPLQRLLVVNTHSSSPLSAQQHRHLPFVCPSLPAPLLDGYHRLFSRGASKFLSTCHRLRKSPAGSRIFNISSRRLIYFLWSFVRSFCGVLPGL